MSQEVHFLQVEDSVAHCVSCFGFQRIILKSYLVCASLLWSQISAGAEFDQVEAAIWF